MGDDRKKWRAYPDVLERLASAIVDNHTHLPVRGDRDYVALLFDVASGVEEGAGEGSQRSTPWHVARMEAAGVRGAITCGYDIPILQSTIALTERWPSLSAAIGIHPNEVPLHRGITEESPDSMAHGLDPWHCNLSLEGAAVEVAASAVSANVVAIGETGLDLYRTAAVGRAAQEEALRMHTELAKDLDLSMQIHDREAHTECMQTLCECGAPERTVLHCFSGDREMAEVCAENGWHASFAGPINHPANETLHEAFMVLPEELILVETDAPYLAPMPQRGHLNAPYASAYMARFMAGLRGANEISWCEALDRNVRRVYGV